MKTYASRDTARKINSAVLALLATETENGRTNVFLGAAIAHPGSNPQNLTQDFGTSLNQIESQLQDLGVEGPITFFVRDFKDTRNQSDESPAGWTPAQASRLTAAVLNNACEQKSKGRDVATCVYINDNSSYELLATGMQTDWQVGQQFNLHGQPILKQMEAGASSTTQQQPVEAGTRH